MAASDQAHVWVFLGAPPSAPWEAAVPFPGLTEPGWEPLGASGEQ